MMNARNLSAAAAALSALASASAANLTVDRDATVTLDAEGSPYAYETVTVHGTLDIPDGVVVEASKVELGPDAGDAAVINVLGASSRLGNAGNARTTLVIGGNGGTGKIVAPHSGGTHNTIWDQTSCVMLDSATVSANAAAGFDGFIDVLDLGPGTVTVQKFVNESATRARVILRNGRINGAVQRYDAVLFTGPFRLESPDGLPFRVAGRNSPSYLTADPGDLEIAGTGNFMVGGYQSNQERYMRFRSGVSWDGVADVVANEQGQLMLLADDALPYGKGRGGLRLETDKNLLNLGARTQHLNFLTAHGARSAADGCAVLGTSGAKLVFGADDLDGHADGAVHPDVAVEKTGAGTLYVTNAASFGSVAVNAGTMRVSAETEIASLSVAEGATLVVDGVALAPAATGGIIGRVELVNGGSLECAVGGASDSRVSGASFAGTLVKTGADSLILEDPAAMPSDIRVDAGTLAFSGAGYAAPLWRFTVTKWFAGNAGDLIYFKLCELALADKDGGRIGKGMTGAANGTAPSALPAGKAAFPEGYALRTSSEESGAGGLNYLFDGASWSRVAVNEPDFGSDGAALTLYWRLPEGAAPASGYSWSPQGGGHPVSWTLAASVDGGATWETLDERTDYLPKTHIDNGMWGAPNATKVGDSETVPLTFTLNSASAAFATGGVAGMPEAAAVEVAAGATLDFTNVTGGQTVSRISVDAATGGGTVKNAALAESGELRVSNWPENAGRVVEIPFALDDAADVGNLRNWRVVADGATLAKRTAHWSAGAIRIASAGFSVVIR